MKFLYLFCFVGLIPLFLSISSENKDLKSPPSSKVQNSYLTERVIVLVIDGPRFSETFGDSTFKNIPNLAHTIAAQGVLVNNFRNNGVTTTVSGHAALCTGVYQNLKNNNTAIPKHPSFFQYYLQQKGINKEKAWVIASKGKLNILANCKAKNWKDTYSPMSFCGVNGSGVNYENDDILWGNTKNILTQYHPNLVLINLLEVDVKGHENNWEGYIQGLKNTDQKALELLNFITNDPYYKGKTTLFITNDHGRHLDNHKDGFVSHGDRCEGCRHIYCVAVGPDFKQKSICTQAYNLTDISKTIAELLQFKVPSSQGQIMTELFK